MGRLVKVFVFLVGVAMVAWGGVLIALDIVGETVAARDVQVRRTGGERGDSSPNRYTYSIDYEFVTKLGEVRSGHSQGIGDSFSVDTPKRICYFSEYPFLNAPEDDCGVGGYSLIMIGLGGFLMWSFSRSARTGSTKGRARAKTAPKLSDSKRPVAQKASGHALSAGEWLRGYRRKSRTYAWGFFCIVVIGISIAVRVGLKEWGSEWFAATGFAVLVTWALAVYSRREANSSWSGKVVSKEVQKRRDTRNPEANTMLTSYVVFAETDRGKRKKIRVNADVFASYKEGGRVRKFPGLTFALPADVEAGAELCPVCGRLLNGATDTCPSCRAPVYGFSELEEACE